MFTLTPLAGAQTTSRISCSLLELDGGVKILVDCGWDTSFDTGYLREIEKNVSSLSLILLTHSTLSHLGAFVHCCKHIPYFSQVPVYATPPVIAFGRTLLQDLYGSAPQAARFIPATAAPVEDENATSNPIQVPNTNILLPSPTLEEINNLFSLITPLKYSQPHQPTPSAFSTPLEGLTLTAYAAGHTLGGTIWHIQHGMESIVFALDWHQARENVISGASWFDGVGGSEVIEALRTPTALVTSSTGAQGNAVSGGRRARDEHLTAHIKSTLTRGGSVLIPSDSSARVLELSWLLESIWADDETIRKAGKVYLCSRSAHATLRYARSLVEWMDSGIAKDIDAVDPDEDAPKKAEEPKGHKRTRSGQVKTAKTSSRPFEFKYVKIVQSRARLEKILGQGDPKVILASDPSAEWGISRTALEVLASKAENLVILTEVADGSTAHTLYTWHQQRQNGVQLEKSDKGTQLEQVPAGGQSLELSETRKTALDESETNVYQQYMAAQRQMQSSLVTSDGRQIGNAEDALDDDDSSSSDESDDDEQQGQLLNASAAITRGNKAKTAISDEDLGVNILLRRKDVFDFDVRNKKGRNAMFPFTHARKRGDEFGDAIKAEDFLRDEEKEAQEAAVLESSRGANIGQKRKWSEDIKQVDTNRRRKSTDGSTLLSDNTDEAVMNDASDDSDDEVETEMIVDTEMPSKIICDKKSVEVHARIAYVDFSSIHDQRSLQMIIPLVKPKRLILISGSADETAALSRDCKTLLNVKMTGGNEGETEILTPRIGETVDASVDTNAWIVKLTRDLVRRMHWQNVKNMSVVTVSGVLKPHVDAELVAAKKQKMLEGQSAVDTTNSANQQAIFDTIPIGSGSGTIQNHIPQPIHVGDMRLADLRRLMNESGHKAVFRGEGTLLVDDILTVRKLRDGQLVVEGMPDDVRNRSYKDVKQKIYAGLAVIAAG